MRMIDINADLGETVGGIPTADDDAMFALVSSASVACGGHAGDAASMARSVALAARHGVRVGAHPSYPDRANFGRLARKLAPGDLLAALHDQLDALVSAGADIRYVKPHGALYHAVTTDPEQARVVVAATAGIASDLGRPVAILGLGGEIESAARAAEVPFVREAFLDRGYLSDGSLVPRERAGALLVDPEEVARRAVRLVREGVVEAVDGSLVDVRAASLCVHGDTPAAVAMARAVRLALERDGIGVAAPW